MRGESKMEQCKQCRKYKKILNDDGICVFCQYGPGGSTTVKKVDPDRMVADGKPLKFVETAEKSE